MITSLPNSPAPSNITRVALGLSGVPIFIFSLFERLIHRIDRIFQDLQD
jgi:hypothetical protein